MYDVMSLQAMRLFLKGCSLEEEGQLRDAVAFYRRAVQLVPDVEQRVHELSLKSGMQSTVHISISVKALNFHK
jgi:hypothetical protein